MNFTKKLKQAISLSRSTLCVGLDPVPERIPSVLKKKYPDEAEQVIEFCRGIIESTKDNTCAYKPNTAFFEALGREGWEILDEVSKLIPSDRIFIADAKRGDIGNTAERYKTAFFDRLNADAITLNALMGMDTLEPYLNDDRKAVFMLTMTSNIGAADFLQRRFEGRLSLGEYMAEELQKKQQRSKTHLGMVIGATQGEHVRPVLKANTAAHLLIPGIGKQGGSVEEVEKLLDKHTGIPLFNSSRSIIYAGEDRPDWLEKVSEKALEMKNLLQTITEQHV